MGDQNLTVHIHTSADADDRDADGFRYQFAQWSGDGLQNHGKRTRFFQGFGILNNAPGCRGILALHFKAAQGAGGLWCQTDVTLHWYAGLDDRPYGGGEIDTTFQFHYIASAFLHQSAGIADSFFHGNVVAHERHVTHDQRPFAAADHGLDVMDHVLHVHCDRAIESHHHHAQRIAHQNDIHTGLICQQTERVVVGSHHDEFPPLFLGLFYIQYSCFRVCHWLVSLFYLPGYLIFFINRTSIGPITYNAPAASPPGPSRYGSPAPVFRAALLLLPQHR